VVLCPAVSLVSIDPAGSHRRPARDAGALAQGRLSLLLALVPLFRNSALDKRNTSMNGLITLNDTSTLAIKIVYQSGQRLENRFA
jgi:hypothetical protein